MTLLTLTAAAMRLGVPEKSLLAKAEEHGHLIRIGRAVRLREDELEELIDKCRIPAKARASTCENEKAETRSMLSSTATAQSSQRARATSESLKRLSRPTSKGNAASVVPLRQKQ